MLLEVFALADFRHRHGRRCVDHRHHRRRFRHQVLLLFLIPLCAALVSKSSGIALGTAEVP